jgi:DNA polymerase III epsilon subunit-like protein
MFILDRPLVILDLETTPANDVNDLGLPRIIEIGAVRVSTTLEVEDTFQTFVNPAVPVPPFIYELTTITPEQIASAPTFAQVAKPFVEFCNGKGSTIAAWGTHFDIPVLRSEFMRLGSEMPLSGSGFCVKSAVKYAMLYAGLKTRNGRWGVGTVCQKLGVTPIEPAHRALNDALTERLLLLESVNLLDGLFTPSEK